MRRTIFMASACLLASSLAGVPLYATDCSQADQRFSISQGSVFNLSSSTFTSAELETSIDYWDGCAFYGEKLPSMTVGGSGGISVSVTKINAQSPGSCGLSQVYPTQSGEVSRAEITVWTTQSNGTSCEPLTDVLAHELGHVFLLRDAEPGTDCRGHIMGDRVLGQLRTVYSDDCEVAHDMWVTETESAPPSDPYCDAYCWTNCIGSVCPTPPPDWEGCPILLDLEGDGIRLTGVGDPVWFDIDSDGRKELMSWTDRGEGFLALDRNGNGRIDDGGELFGNHTPLSQGGTAINGYLALAELDTLALGGNEDGFIDSVDFAFQSLMIWSDLNHNGLSEPQELMSLETAGITRIAVEYRRSNRTDRNGNELRFFGRAWRTGHRRVEPPILTWDVFFRVVPR